MPMQMNNLYGHMFLIDIHCRSPNVGQLSPADSRVGSWHRHRVPALRHHRAEDHGPSRADESKKSHSRLQLCDGRPVWFHVRRGRFDIFRFKIM